MTNPDYRDEERFQDLEKLSHEQSIDESDDDYSTTTSEYSLHSGTRILSSQYRSEEAILAQYTRPRHERHASTVRVPLFRQTACTCTPRKCTRYFSLVLIFTVAILMITLTRLSWTSSRNVGLGVQRPAPPPSWLNYEFLARYYGGIRTLVSHDMNIPEYPQTQTASEPLPASENEPSEDEQNIPKSIAFAIPRTDDVVKCFLDDQKLLRIPDVRVYAGAPKGMPESVIGSHEVVGTAKEHCFDRFGRLGPYGLGYSASQGGSGAAMDGDREGIEELWEEDGPVDFSRVDWRRAQETCLHDNWHRYYANSTLESSAPESVKRGLVSQSNATTQIIPRKAVIIRTWSDYDYDDEDLFFLRSLAWELSLQTGSEYTLHFLIHVRDDRLPIWSDEMLYKQVLAESLPSEFAGMGTLWSERQMQLMYNTLPFNEFRDLPLHGVYRSHHMPLTWFASKHPEFEYFWQVEMDMRYTGHYHELITKAEQWAAKQPRKGLWERNARFYVPAEHGSWEDFSHMARVQSEHGTSTHSNLFSDVTNNPSIPVDIKNQIISKAEKAIWGPEPPANDFHDNSTDIRAPHPMSQDKTQWGVGEEVDLIVFNPLFDPQSTNWLLAEDVTGYNRSEGLPPRRAVVNSFGRYSKRLLSTMHRDMTLHGKHMFSEMFPASTALHHGHKAVYVPHAVYVDRNWPTDLLAATFNGGRNGRAGGSRLSVFSQDREHNFKGVSWYYNSGFAPALWKRWLGYQVDGAGGAAKEVAGEGRMCLPAMLLHPVKQVDLIYQDADQ